MVLINGFGILMGGLMMRAGLMMVIVWVDDGDSFFFEKPMMETRLMIIVALIIDGSWILSQ